MGDEELATLVGKYKCVYQKTHKYYKVKERKLAAWRQIAHQLGVTEEQCTKRWKTLRDRYTREYAKETSGEANPDQEWYLLKTMDFLRPYIQFRPKRRVSYKMTLSPNNLSVSPVPSSNHSASQFAHKWIPNDENDDDDETRDEFILPRSFQKQSTPPDAIPRPILKRVRESEPETSKLETTTIDSTNCEVDESVEMRSMIAYGKWLGDSLILMKNVKFQVDAMDEISQIITKYRRLAYSRNDPLYS